MTPQLKYSAIEGLVLPTRREIYYTSFSTVRWVNDVTVLKPLFELPTK